MAYRTRNHSCDTPLPSYLEREEAAFKFYGYHLDNGLLPACKYALFHMRAHFYFINNSDATVYTNSTVIEKYMHTCSNGLPEYPTSKYYQWHQRNDKVFCRMSKYAKKWYEWLWYHPNAAPEDYKPWTRRLPANVYCYYFPTIGFYIGATTVSKDRREQLYTGSNNRMRRLLDACIPYEYIVLYRGLEWEDAVKKESSILDSLKQLNVYTINIAGANDIDQGGVRKFNQLLKQAMLV